jgi:hypothetical protein
LKKNNFVFCLTLLFAVLFKYGSSQSYTVKFNVSGQPETQVILGTIRGDDFVAIDSVLATNEKIQFTFPLNAHSGIYRVVFGQTTYARVMNKDPQQIDFIFNKENITINTQFEYPKDSAQVLSSKENTLWYAFLNYEKNYIRQYTIQEKELDLLWTKKDTANALEKSNEFNRLQMARDLYIGQNAQQNTELLVAKMIYQYREPIMDGYLTPEERKAVFQKYFFKTVDFSNERLISSSVYTDKVFQYLVSYNNPTYTQNQREVEYIKAVDVILENTNKNEKVHQFIIDYLIHGFGVLKLENVISYINENYR